MSLSEETLVPLTAQSIPFTFIYDRPLKTIATRYVPVSRTTSPTNIRHEYTLLFSCGVSLNQELWVPTIKRLFDITSQPSSQIHIRSAWVLERPNHGDAALLNEEELKKHYSTSFTERHYSAAFRTFLASDIISLEEKNNLIGITHSGGGGSLIQGLEPYGIASELRIRALILVEPPYVGPEARQEFIELCEAVIFANSRRQKNWSSKEEALGWMTTHVPWKKFHPEVLQIISETYFRPDPSNPSEITTKTRVDQEIATYNPHTLGLNLAALPYLHSNLQGLPIYLINGAKHDIWPKRLQSSNDLCIKRDLESKILKSLTIIEGVGHYIPQQEPQKLAEVIIGILEDNYEKSFTQPTRL